VTARELVHVTGPLQWRHGCDDCPWTSNDAVLLITERSRLVREHITATGHAAWMERVQRTTMRPKEET
jgi:hypothetical protein